MTDIKNHESVSHIRLILDRENVVLWKAMYLHEIPEYEGELPPIDEVAEVWNEKIELEENQAPVMCRYTRRR